MDKKEPSDKPAIRTSSGRPAEGQDRVIRVFISSTFRDMQKERELLVKEVFPDLRRVCRERFVEFTEVDLRWGITEEQRAEGKVLPICLEEIERSRPYFIGMLGERYGWIPTGFSAEVMAREPWLQEHVGSRTSVTELEILHGVLNNPAMADRAFFYFRDPGYVESLPEDERREMLERDIPDDVERFGKEEASRRTEERKRKLRDLKDRIRRSGRPVETYADPRAFAEAVRRQFLDLVDRLYPKDLVPDALAREAAEHDAFARSRAGVYIGRQEYFDRLDAHAAGDGPPLVVLGESGSGKSVLLANWALRCRAAHPDDLVILHFIGASRYSADWAAMVRRIMRELQRRLDIQSEIPNQADALRLAFANCLHMAAARGRVVLVLDALNQLEDRDQAPNLVWLPPEVPANIRLVVSTLPGRPLDDIKRRGWPTFAIEPLRLDERQQLIVDYLAQYRKALSPDDAARIAAAPQSANPLYLCALLEELRVFGVHEQLDNHIDHYLAADTIPALYERILARWEQDYDRDRPNLVRDAMTCLWAARRGLSESELLGLLRTDGEPMPRAYWSPLHLAADHSLVTRSGLIGFSHDHLRTAVRRRYLGDNRQRAAHLTLADYFAGMGVGQRKVDELPWQLERASAWQQLQDLLTDGSFFMAAWAADDFMGQFEVKRYWAQLEANSPFRVADAYGSVLDGSVETGDLDFAYQVARLVLDTGYPQKALPLMARIVRHFRSRGKPAALVGPLVTLAVMLQDAGRLDEAWATHREAERLCRETGDRAALAATLQNEGVILRDTGKLREAVGRFDEAVAIFGEIGGSAELLHCLGHEIPALVVIGDRSRAMGLLDELERVSRAHGYIPGIIEALNKRGADLGMQRRWRESLTAHEREATLCRQVGDRVGLQRALGSQALALGQLQDFEPALALYEEAEAICRGIGNKTGLGCSLGGRARILREMGQLDQAQALQEEEASLWRELGNEMALGACLVEQAVTAQRQGDLGRAVRLMASAQSILARCGIDPSKIAGQ